MQADVKNRRVSLRVEGKTSTRKILLSVTCECAFYVIPWKYFYVDEVKRKEIYPYVKEIMIFVCIVKYFDLNVKIHFFLVVKHYTVSTNFHHTQSEMNISDFRKVKMEHT